MDTQETTGRAGQGIVLQVLFRTDMAVEEALRKVEETREVFERVPGLRQKYYIRDPVTGELGGLYVFDSRESLERFRETGVSQKIIQSFNPLGPPAIRVFEIGTALAKEEPLAPREPGQ